MTNNKPSIWDILSSVMAIAAVILSVVFGTRDYRLNQRVVELEEEANARAVAAEKRATEEVIQIRMETDDLQVFMLDSAACYNTHFKNVTSDPQEHRIEFRIPTTIHITNNSEKQVLIASASLDLQKHPSEGSSSGKKFGYFGSTARSRPPVFDGNIKTGGKQNFVVPGNDNYTIEADVLLPINNDNFWSFLESFIERYPIPVVTDDTADDIAEQGSEYVRNQKIDNIFMMALSDFCRAEESYYTLDYTVTTAQENIFSCGIELR